MKYSTISDPFLGRIHLRLGRLYGPEQAQRLMRRFQMLLGRYGIDAAPAAVGPTAKPLWDETDVVLITYADSLQAAPEAPLATLRRFCCDRLRGLFRTVHILPFYPWSSDDGFSVIDYRKVHPAYGTWDDITRFAHDFRLMFDLVLNHCSRQSAWFRDFVTGIAPARYFFHVVDPATDLRSVVRPRPWPLLSRTATRDGEAWVWTTFSADQIDLNWQNPDVLFEFLDILFFYLAKGCRMLRLDAVAFLWKRIGTNCLHLPETHEVVKLLRDVVELVAPETIIITETNVPHEENIRYFGDADEAHMVYNFSLPPLLLHALLRNDASHLTQWAAGLPHLSRGQAFFNFTASHDGIGVRPLQGILPDSERDWLAQQVLDRGGRVSMKADSDGTQSPYELNISYIDALGDPADEQLGLARFLCSQAVMLSLKGVPAVYIHSLLGTPNDYAAVAASGQNRSINRHKWRMDDLMEKLSEEGSRMAIVFAKYSQWLRRRVAQPAFAPDAEQVVLDLGPGLFAIQRIAVGRQTLVCVFNFTREPQVVPLANLHTGFAAASTIRDVLNATTITPGARRCLKLAPYQACWLAVK